MNKFKMSSEKETKTFIRLQYLKTMVELLKIYKESPRPDLIKLIKELGEVAKQNK